jgi:ribonuclease HI
MNTEGVDKEGKSLLICTDSLPFVETMKTGPINQKLDPVVRVWSDVLTLIDDFGVEKVDILWGKGHEGVEKNEKVDALVRKAVVKFEKEKTGASQKKSPILLQGFKAEVNLQLFDAYRGNLQTTDHR